MNRFVVFLTITLATPCFAQEQEIELSRMTCGSVQRMDATDISVALAWMHHGLGMREDLDRIDIGLIRETADRVIDHCRMHPEDVIYDLSKEFGFR